MFVEQTEQVSWWDYALLEMSIIPIPHESKRPDYRWSRLRWTKLHVLMESASGQRMYSKFFQVGGGGLAVVCGRPSENLFVIDCDTIDALGWARRQLLARGIDAPCVYSSRGGHLYLRAREGAVKTIPAGTMTDLEIRGDGAIAVLPPTRHESGITYRWANGHPPRNIPTVSVDDIDFLIGNDGQSVALSVGSGGKRLHDDTRDYLARGHRLATGVRNSRLFDAARDYRYVGRDSGTALHDLLPIALLGGLSEDEAVQTILSPYRSHAPRSAATPNKTDQLQAFMIGMQWPGRCGKTDRRVFEALTQRRRDDARRHKDGIFRATYRELMTIARVGSWKTVQRSLDRLKSRGYLEFAGQEESMASLWRFSDLVMHAGSFFLLQNVHIKQQCSSRSDYCGHFAQLSESAAFGTTGTNILILLRKNKLMTAAAITSSIGCHRTTTSRNLKKLITAGFVQQIGTKFMAVDVSVSDERSLVVDSGAYAMDQDRQARFDQERALFALNPILQFLFERQSS